ncbi:MAG: M14 family metallopeptidase [Patescibacteria group bacterium]
MKPKNIVIGLIIIIVLVVGGYLMFRGSPEPTDIPNENEVTPPPPAEVGAKQETVIGKSVGGRDITAYHYRASADVPVDTRLLFVGGIHGGYSWNTAALAYELIDYLERNSINAIPRNVEVTVIPVLNPDGLNKVVARTGAFTKADVSGSDEAKISSRFNANSVDLNRNFDCEWKTQGTWQSTTVSGGSAPFSEPETMALKNFVESYKPTAVVSWYSSVGGVFSSNCKNGVLPETAALTSVYAKAAGYPAYKTFDFYAITGDMSNWFAKNNIPAISVLLTTHEDTELTKNLAGVDALFARYAK